MEVAVGADKVWPPFVDDGKKLPKRVKLVAGDQRPRRSLRGPKHAQEIPHRLIKRRRVFAAAVGDHKHRADSDRLKDKRLLDRGAEDAFKLINVSDELASREESELYCLPLSPARPGPVPPWLAALRTILAQNFVDEEPWLRRNLTLEMEEEIAVDRLGVERFKTRLVCN